ncbi:hypothetical protein KDM41_09170 [bacterium]|nr:hypothetical protein [bacterium]
MTSAVVLAALALLAAADAAAASPECAPTATHAAARIVAVDAAGGLRPQAAPEVRAGERFVQTVADRWIFALEPREFGWAVRIYDPHAGAGPDAADLSAPTPPLHLDPNPRDLAGWHFRNAANTGPNRGDVNAPQHLRRFVFALDAAGLADPDAARGEGWLHILDFRLTPPEPGRRARLTDLRFEACLAWPRPDPSASAEASSAPEDVEIFGACGLGRAGFALDAAFAPPALTGDLDGDGSHDRLVQVRRRSDGRRALALCRAGTWLHVMGPDAGPLPPGWLDRLEAWRLVPRDHGPFGYVDEPPWPEAAGDVLVLERLEKEMILVFWRDGGLRAQQVYRMVEP